MSNGTTARLRATAVAVAPALLLFGFLYHPYVTIASDTEAIGAEAAADTTP